MNDKFYNLDYYLKDDVLYKVLGINGDNPPTKEQELFIDWLHNFAKIYKKTKQEFINAYTASFKYKPQLETLYRKTAKLYTKWCEETTHLQIVFRNKIQKKFGENKNDFESFKTCMELLQTYILLVENYDIALTELRDEIGSNTLEVKSVQDAKLVLNKIEEEVLNNPINDESELRDND